MEIDTRTEEGRAILTVRGRQLTGPGDLAAFQRTVDDLLEKGIRDFTLDLDVGYVDSAALGELVRLYSGVSAAGGSLKMTVPKRVQRLLRLIKLWPF